MGAAGARRCGLLWYWPGRLRGGWGRDWVRGVGRAAPGSEENEGGAAGGHFLWGGHHVHRCGPHAQSEVGQGGM